MENVVGLKARRDDRRWVGFMTWGRVVDRVDDTWLIDALRSDLQAFGIPQDAEIVVCDTLQDVSECPYFYEALLDFAHRGIPRGKKYEKWRARRAKDVESGAKIFYGLGLCPEVG